MGTTTGCRKHNGLHQAREDALTAPPSLVHHMSAAEECAMKDAVARIHPAHVEAIFNYAHTLIEAVADLSGNLVDGRNYAVVVRARAMLEGFDTPEAVKLLKQFREGNHLATLLHPYRAGHGINRKPVEEDCGA